MVGRRSSSLTFDPLPLYSDTVSVHCRYVTTLPVRCRDVAAGGDGDTITGVGRRAPSWPLKLATRSVDPVLLVYPYPKSLTVEQPPKSAGGYTQIEIAIEG